MAFLHRKLTTDSDSPSNIPNTTPIFCNTICVEEKQNGSCPPSCLSLCPNLCNPTTPISNQSSSHEKASIFLIVGLSLLATTFFLVCFYVFYRKYWLSSRIRRPISDSQVDDENNDHSNHSNDQVLIHPIWYINTVGLQSSVINSITVCKYKKGEGLIEDLDCAVCLSEFEEDESLRLLPKCSHAFHLPCIDNWLRSHTNCPLCRAPIVVTNVVTSISTPQEETQLSTLENDGESDTQRGRQVHELRIRIENEEEQEQVESMNEQVNRMSNEEAIRRIEPRRRSVSLDSSSASKIVNESHSRFVSNGNSNTQLQVVNKSKSVNGAKGLGLGLQKFQRQKGASSSKGRSSHKSGAISMKRSFSNSGIHRQILSRDSNRPLRSF